ncbi:MAG TPA: Rieske 2Fe-2S domain-containing protein [Acidimicrobiales bacterium]
MHSAALFAISSTAVVAIVIVAVVLAGALLLVTAARRGDARRGAGALSRETRKRDRGETALDERGATGKEFERQATEARSTALEPVAVPTPPAPYVPPDAETLGVTRRQFFNRSAVTLMSVGLGGFGAACIAFLWPQLSGGFGSKIAVGKLEDVIANIRANKNFFYLAEGRAWLTEYPAESLPKAEVAYGSQGPVFEGMKNGLSALYQKCPHLGCRVPDCPSSQWFECPCHGSQYNRVGEKKAGPAPRGMDHFGVSVTGGVVVVDTGVQFPGPPIGTNTTGQEAEGPHCITGGGEH